MVEGDRGKEIQAQITTLTGQQEERLAQHRAQGLNLSYVNLTAWPLDAEVLALVPREEAEKAGAVLFYKKGRDVRLGVVNPARAGFSELREKIAEQTGVKPQTHIISQRSLQVALSRYVKPVAAKLDKDEVRINQEQLKDAAAAVRDLQTLGEKISEVSPSEILTTILAGAVAIQASDVHIEPRRRAAQIRYRIDGVLSDAAAFAADAWRRVLSRVRTLASLKLNVQGVPQDGNFVLRIDGATFDVRVSILPGAFGENIVLRMLNREASEAVDLAGLGMKARDLKIVQDELKKSTGMVLAAGPTGSGKTTTIVACLREINRPELKVITLEDPIEYRVAGTEQTEIDVAKGYTFAVGLRSILRQDPDIIFVGEMRDAETAETCLQAAMTGHLVFSTVHANDAPGVVLRIFALGIKPYVLAPAVNVIISQRLVRRVCQACGEEYEANDELLTHIRKVMAGVPESVFDIRQLDKPLNFLRAKGCAQCNGTGYRGRVGVFEVLAVRDEVEELILRGMDSNKIKAAALKTGMTTIAQDAYLKVIEKITTVEEVQRISEE